MPTCTSLTAPMLKLLFICTHNRCRSILSEAITNHFANNRIEARSAGSQPSGEVHPLSLKYLQQHGFSTEGLTSQSWDKFELWKPDIVITVCDSAAQESCPVWLGEAIKIHWGLSDPSKLAKHHKDSSQVNNEIIETAFRRTIKTIQLRVQGLLALPFESYSKEKLTKTLVQLGETHGSV